MGKPVGSDLMHGTLTLPALLLIERYPDENPVQRYFAGRQGQAENLQAGPAANPDSDILDESMQVALNFRDKGLAALATVGTADDPAIESLTDVAYWVTQRRN